MAWKLLACRDLYEHRLLLVATEDDEPNNYHAMPGLKNEICTPSTGAQVR